MMKTNHFLASIALIVLIACFFSCGNDKAHIKLYTDVIYKKPPLVKIPKVDFLSPEESLKTMYLPEGYSIELVASEPMINEPVVMEWDANGKLYVAEMLTYMQDVDATDENEPWSRISVLEDTNGDGKMDKSTIFIDSLILPRIIMPLDDRVLVGETFNRHIWSYRDTNGDNVADEKIKLLDIPKRDNGNLEHQTASILWNIDNYMYLSKGSVRYRFTHNKIETDTMLDAPDGQWGLTQDETGQMYYSSAGGENPALGFQRHPTYGNLELEGQKEKSFDSVWPIIGTPDVQGGFKRLREDGTLNHFTASSGQAIFLGDKLPMYGDLFIPEPVGRLIRRAKVERINGKTVLTNKYGDTEFLASTDANFRPVDMKTGPDGCLYVVDMYRGIIQEGNWTRKGSFLRPVIEEMGLDKNIGKGRIYRIVHNEIQPSKPVKLLDKSSEELIPYLSHANGWYRINAQKLIILKQDTSILPRLKKMVTSEDNALGRLHALWTLEGLDAIDEEIILKSLKDEDPRVKQAAIRLGEPFLKEDNKTILKAIIDLKDDNNIEIPLQLVNSFSTYKTTETKAVIKEVVEKHMNNEVISFVGTEALKDVPPVLEQLKKKHVLQNSKVKKAIIEGYKNYQSICAACHGKDGKGIGDLAPSLIGSPRIKGDQEITAKILLNGLTGPIDGKEYSGVMVGMKYQDDEWLASVLTYIRTELNDAPPILEWRLKNIKNRIGERDSYWTMEELYQ
ncbi:MAG: PVC-type heme-binding CxxCH protein [Jejuia sp.]